MRIRLIGAEGDKAFLRQVAGELRAEGHDIAPPLGKGGDSSIAELERLAAPILQEMEGAQPMPLDLRVFLSYSSRDEEVVRAFRHALQGRGVLVSDYASKIRGTSFGPRWMEGELKALSECCSVLVFWSRAAMESEQVNFELTFTLARMSRRSGVLLGFAVIEEVGLRLEDSSVNRVVVIDLRSLPIEEGARVFQDKLVIFLRAYLNSAR